jgi:hypothetical protein
MHRWSIYQRDSRPEVTKAMAIKAPAIPIKTVANVGAFWEKNKAVTANITHIMAIPV